MKRTLTTLALSLAFAAPVFAESAIEVKVPANPTDAEIQQAHENVVKAAKTVCKSKTRIGLNVIERRVALSNCIKASYEAAVEDGRKAKMTAFLSEADIELN